MLIDEAEELDEAAARKLEQQAQLEDPNASKELAFPLERQVAPRGANSSVLSNC